jgi:hypothetical protein
VDRDAHGCRIGVMLIWTSMRRHCLSRADVAAGLCGRGAIAYTLRAMLLSALSVNLLFGGSVHTMRSVLIRALLRRCNLPSGLCSCRMGQVHVRSHLWRSEVIGRAMRVRHFLGSSLPLCQLPSPPLPSFTVSSCLPLSRLLLLLAPLGVVEWLIDLRRYPQTVQKHT